MHVFWHSNLLVIFAKEILAQPDKDTNYTNYHLQ